MPGFAADDSEFYRYREVTSGLSLTAHRGQLGVDGARPVDRVVSRKAQRRLAEREIVMSQTRIPGFCALCKSRCGANFVVSDGRLISQEANPDHPTGQALCVKGKAAPEIVYNPQRQLYPLRRTRPKGDADPGWQRISWDEALEEVADRLGRIRDEHGAEAIAFGVTTPSGTPISDDLRWIERFINAFGSPNTAYATEICNWHKDFAHAFTFGRSIASPDFENTGCVVLWGHNPSATWLDHATSTAAARARGARLVVVDPRRVGFASRADQWLRVRPGADGMLALSIAGEMIENGWFDAEFIRDWSNGPLLVRCDTNAFLRAGDLAVPPSGAMRDDYVAINEASGQAVGYSLQSKGYADVATPRLDTTIELVGADGRAIACRSAFALYRALCAEHPPERVEREAWVPAAQVRATARLLFEARPVSYYAWSGLGQHTNATQTDRAVSLLMALTGSFDAPGGNVEFAKPKAADVSGAEFMDAEQRAKCIDLLRSPLGPGRNGWVGSDALYDAILEGKPYPIRALFGFGRNLVITHADGNRAAQALSKLPFHVQTDVVMSPTAAFADIFLPVNTPWEREALRVGFEGSQRAENLIQFRPAAIASRGESRSDGQIVFDLAQRLGFGDRFWNGDIDAGFAAVLQPLGIPLDVLRAHPEGISVDGEPHYHRYRRNGFKTPTGRIEVFSQALRDIGQDPLPRFVEPALSPASPEAARFPLVLTSAKVVHYCHSQHRHVRSLRRRSPDPEVSLHPKTAELRGIGESDWVEIRTANGRARMRAKFDSSLDPRVVSAQYGWWQSNDELGLPGYDPLSPVGANYNTMVSDRESDPISGSTGLRSSLCEIVAVRATERA
jgi:anaerobic selenocysteine-containing dehydrogenase